MVSNQFSKFPPPFLPLPHVQPVNEAHALVFKGTPAYSNSWNQVLWRFLRHCMMKATTTTMRMENSSYRPFNWIRLLSPRTLHPILQLRKHFLSNRPHLPLRKLPNW